VRLDEPERSGPTPLRTGAPADESRADESHADESRADETYDETRADEILAEVDRLLPLAPAAQGLLTLDTERGRRSYLLGPRTHVEGGVAMLDWRSAPLAEAFFRYRPGDRYEIETGERTTSGRVVARWVIANHGEVLIDEARGIDRRSQIAGGGDPDGSAGGAGGRAPRGINRAGVRPAPRPQPIAVAPSDRSVLPVLDPEQQAAVDLPADTSLILDGEAGVGKTLVALFRIASLERRARAKSRRFRALVLVPTEGLRRLVRILAERLAIERLEVGVIDDWLIERARIAFPGLPRRTSEDAAGPVIALKRHPAVRVALDEMVGWKPPRTDDKLARSRTRLLHLFGDKGRLERILAASGGALPARAVVATMAHTRVQFEATTERAFSHVDADRLVALDGRRLDAGTPMNDAHTFDAEDVPVLFELVRRGALPAVALSLYDHIVIDEAQLRAPMELAAIGDALAPHASVTLAGDHRQATDETAWFTGWPAARAELRRPRWVETTLSVTYRSVPAISAFARAIVDGTPAVPAEPPADPAVWASRSPGALAQAAALCWHLDALLTRDPWREICVIARTPEHARRLHAELSRGLDPTLVLDGDFRFTPGVVVTTAAAVSGLEFDTVVIPDLSPPFYPATPELARALYVAATRARDWLWLLTPGDWSPLVSPVAQVG
jgi:DNA helicase-2/ATP-dependent DNA helicase PcrA